MSFKVVTKEYAFDEFLNNIIVQELPSYNTFKIACYLTDYNDWNSKNTNNLSLTELFEINRFKLENLGEIKRIIQLYYDKDINKEINVIFYLYLQPETKLLFCITDAKTNIIKDIFGKFVNYNIGIYYLFISASAFYYIARKIKELDGKNECIYFSARHLPSYVTKGKYRPENKRTIIYHSSGGDGLDTLDLSFN
jgi:hypothetical protein